MTAPVEIERKFLVRPGWSPPGVGRRIRQSYLDNTPGMSVRVREFGDDAFLTIKARKAELERYEFEYPIPLSHAAAMIERICDRPPITKTRYEVVFAGKTWEIDIFEGDNAGLVIAEIELHSVDEAFALPDWVTVEVSHRRRYGNADLYTHPYCLWTDLEKSDG